MPAGVWVGAGWGSRGPGHLFAALGVASCGLGFRGLGFRVVRVSHWHLGSYVFLVPMGSGTTAMVVEGASRTKKRFKVGL